MDARFADGNGLELEHQRGTGETFASRQTESVNASQGDERQEDQKEIHIPPYHKHGRGI